VAIRHRGDLDVADGRAQLADETGEIPVHDLGVVEVELHPHVGSVYLLHQGQGVELVGQEVAGYISIVERLQQHLDAVFGQEVGGEADVVDQVWRWAERL
jgi:hypothetical protein